MANSDYKYKSKPLEDYCSVSNSFDDSLSTTLESKSFNGFTGKVFAQGPHTITNNKGTSYTVNWGQNAIPEYTYQGTTFLADKTKTPIPIRLFSSSGSSAASWQAASGRKQDINLDSTSGSVSYTISYSSTSSMLTIRNNTTMQSWSLSCYGEAIIDAQARGGTGAVGTESILGITPSGNNYSGGGGGGGAFASVHIDFKKSPNSSVTVQKDSNGVVSLKEGISGSSNTTTIIKLNQGGNASGITRGKGGTSSVEATSSFVTPLIVLDGGGGGYGGVYYNSKSGLNQGNDAQSADIYVSKALPDGKLGTINSASAGGYKFNGYLVHPGGGAGGASFMGAGGTGQAPEYNSAAAGNGTYGSGGGGGTFYVSDGGGGYAESSTAGAGGGARLLVYT